MGMMQHLISSMAKGEAMGRRDCPRGTGLVHQTGGRRGRRTCPQHSLRGGTVMSGTWAEKGIVTMKERGRKIVTGREKETGKERRKGIGTRMTETVIAIITGTGTVILSAMETGTGEGHLGCTAGREMSTILSVGG